MYQRIYQNGDVLKVTNQLSMWFNDQGKVIDFDDANDKYLIEIRTNLYSRDVWFDFDDLYPVYSGIGSAISNTLPTKVFSRSPNWITDDYSFSNSRCSHSWTCDYESIFTTQKYYSCTKCKIKKEEFDKEEKDAF